MKKSFRTLAVCMLTAALITGNFVQAGAYQVIPGTTNIALSSNGSVATANKTLTDGVIGNLNDGDDTTTAGYSTSTTVPSLQVNLGSTKSLAKITIKTGSKVGSYGYNEEIYVSYSTDNSTYTRIAYIPGGSSGQNKTFDYAFDVPITAQYIKVGSSSSSKRSIILKEIEAYEADHPQLTANTYSAADMSAAAGTILTGTLDYNNPSETSYPLIYVMALYENTGSNKILKDIAVSSGSLDPGESLVQASLDLTGYTAADLENYEIKTFVLSDLSNITPYKETAVFPAVITPDI